MSGNRRPARRRLRFGLPLASRGATRCPTFQGIPCQRFGAHRRALRGTTQKSTGRAFRRRLAAVDADLAMVSYSSPDTGTTLADVEAIRADIFAMPTPPALVVFDTLGGFMPGKASLDNMADMRRLLRPLAALAEETGSAIVLLHHEGKGARTNAMHAGIGSIGIAAAMRSALVCGEPQEDGGPHLMAHVKSR